MILQMEILKLGIHDSCGGGGPLRVYSEAFTDGHRPWVNNVSPNSHILTHNFNTTNVEVRVRTGLLNDTSFYRQTDFSQTQEGPTQSWLYHMNYLVYVLNANQVQVSFYIDANFGSSNKVVDIYALD